MLIQKLELPLFVVVCCCFFVNDANTASCRNFGNEAKAAIGGHVAALRAHEREASDRLKGLDSRPFEFLLGEARKTATIIADPAALKLEEGLEQCRNEIRPVRRICAEAAHALVEVLEKYATTPTPDVDKPRFADTMEECEKLMGLKPLKSIIRGTD